MKRILLLTFTLVSLSLTGQSQNHLTPELLWEFGRVSGGAVSPDGEWVLYGITYYDVEENTGDRNLYIVSVDGGDPIQITRLEGHEYNETWRPDGNKIGFLSAHEGSAQFYEINTDGTGMRKVTNIEGGVNNVSYSPNMEHLMFTKKVKLERKVNEMFDDLPKANARLIDELMYRHWDEWSDYSYNHIFYAKYGDGGIKPDPVDIMPNELADSPLEPFGGRDAMSWSPDGKLIAYTSKKITGIDYATTTNSDIYVYNTGTGETENVTLGMAGYDKRPVFSPDGKYMAWSSMERAGFESDRNRIFIMELGSGEKREITRGLDRNANSPVWSDNGKYMYFSSGENATYQLFKIRVRNGKTDQITSGYHDYRSLEVAGDMLIGMKMTISSSNELYKVDPGNGEETQLTFTNQDIYDRIEMGRVEERWILTSDSQQMHTWVIYPPDFDSTKKYATLLYCQGGPQATVSQFFSFRWNFQLMAANGYIVVAPNRRGLPSFGQEWNDQISGDWGGQAMQDYLSAIDALADEPYVDQALMGAVGASFGGYSVYWLAGNHDYRFKCFVSHCGVFNLTSWYGSTEELFFANWDLGGPYWWDELADEYDKFSPHNYVQNWNAPMLVIHGQKDFRVPVTEGMQAFQAAQIKGIPSQFLYFPEEGHWVLSPQNGILWHRVFFGWLSRFLHVSTDR